MLASARRISIKSAAIWLAFLIATGAARSQATSPTPAIGSIHQLFLEDQEDRTSNKLDPPQVEKRDTERRVKAKAILEAGSLHTADDFHDAAFIFQHSLKSDDYLLAHVLASAAVAKGDRRSVWISAATLDRYLQSSGQPQVFGTQYGGPNFWYFVQHPVNPDMNDPRAKDTTPQMPYNRALLPDSVRSIFCVVDQDTQKKNVAAMSEGKSFTRKPGGCPAD